ncbi:hypothetical protein BS17DRAFT_308768 [Gyrodon lividus]|nr:hypothetical protein BS17DRAFT_308768 [Gyrodon lividus]
MLSRELRGRSLVNIRGYTESVPRHWQGVLGIMAGAYLVVNSLHGSRYVYDYPVSADCPSVPCANLRTCRRRHSGYVNSHRHRLTKIAACMTDLGGDMWYYLNKGYFIGCLITNCGNLAATDRRFLYIINILQPSG